MKFILIANLIALLCLQNGSQFQVDAKLGESFAREPEREKTLPRLHIRNLAELEHMAKKHEAKICILNLFLKILPRSPLRLRMTPPPPRVVYFVKLQSVRSQKVNCGGRSWFSVTENDI